MPKGVRGFVKGQPKIGGRAKGTPNKVTRDVKEIMRLFAENKAPQLEALVARIAKSNPEKAADIIMRGMEFTLPKLQRTEMTGLDGAAFSVSLDNKDSKL